MGIRSGPVSDCCAWLMVAVLVGCGSADRPAAELGARLFADSSLSPSPLNAFSCETCHGVLAQEPSDAGTLTSTGPRFPGYNLFDSAFRSSWWGGYETRLLDAINYCLAEFMGGAKLERDDLRARELYEYLASVSPENPAPALPLTIVKTVTDLSSLRATADANRGLDIYDRACLGCHGDPHTGRGKLGPKTTVVPEETLNGEICNPKTGPAPPDKTACARAVVVEKIRHGKFFNIGGVMPFYSVETMSDMEIADLLAFLDL